MSEVREAHGFCADPGVPIWLNAENYYRQMNPINFSGHPTNRAFHNLCKTTPIPVGTKSLLGMGLKFCPTRPCPTNNINKTTKRLRKDVRRIAFLHHKPAKKKPGVRYIPELYINKKLTAPEFYPDIEKCLDNFERYYRRRCLSHQKKLSLTNLTPWQQKAAKKLRNNNDVIATETDKNMGGATVTRPVYNT